MKKLSLFVLSALLVFGITQARAEMSPQTVSGTNYTDNQVYTIMYNNSGATVTANCVVILDTSATAASTLGSYFTTTTSAGSSYIVGVTDEQVSSGKTGRICIRGPHLVNLGSVPTAGDSISTTTTAGWGASQTSTANKYGYLGVALAQGTNTQNWWVWIRPNNQ